MRILYISNKKLVNKDEALKWFKFYCEESDDLHLYQNLRSAKDFLIKEILEEKKHIDFIITDWKFGSENAKSLLSWIRQSEEIYSSDNFLFRSLPVILIEDRINQSATINDGFDSVIQDFPNDSLKLKNAIKDAIKTWRYSLAGDLSLIGLDPKTQIIHSDHRMNFISYYRLKILTRQFVNNKSKRLNYIWTNEKSDILYDSSSEFLDKMNRTIKNPPKYLEKEFHDFFIKNPIFIKGEDFLSMPKEMIYEKHFYKNGTKSYDEPDFVNKPYDYVLRYPEIFEIKRQSQRLFTKKSDRFLSRTKKSFEQVKRYKDYFESDDPEHKAYIKKHLGEIYSSYEYTLLMGSRDEKLEHQDLIEKLKCDFDFTDIKLLTYEELLERHIRLCDRLYEFDIFK
jgi:hypothetical protein